MTRVFSLYHNSPYVKGRIIWHHVLAVVSYIAGLTGAFVWRCAPPNYHNIRLYAHTMVFYIAILYVWHRELDVHQS